MPAKRSAEAAAEEEEEAAAKKARTEAGSSKMTMKRASKVGKKAPREYKSKEVVDSDEEGGRGDEAEERTADKGKGKAVEEAKAKAKTAGGKAGELGEDTVVDSVSIRLPLT